MTRSSKAFFSFMVLASLAFLGATCVPALAQTPPARNQPGIAVHPENGTSLLFGGEGADGLLADTWVCRNAAWQRRSQDSPGPRSRTSFAVAPSDASGTFLLFGGWAEGERLGDAWRFTREGWTRLPDAPPARSAHRLVFDSDLDRTVLFGGSANSGLLADLWFFESGEWTQVEADGPQARRNHAMAYDPGRRSVILFGGATSEGRLADTWEFRDGKWTHHDGPGPAARDHHAMTFSRDLGGVVLFGGWDGAYRSDLWLWADGTWSLLSDDGPERAGRPGLLDTADGLVLFGGADSDGPVGEVFRYDGSTWSPSRYCQ